MLSVVEEDCVSVLVASFFVLFSVASLVVCDDSLLAAASATRSVLVCAGVVVSAETLPAPISMKEKPSKTEVAPKLYFLILNRCLASSVCRALNFFALGFNMFIPSLPLLFYNSYLFPYLLLA